MESPSRALTLSPPPLSHHTTTTTRWPEFEFEFDFNRFSSQTTLHSADELFSDGFLLPLQLLHLNRSENDHEPDPDLFDDEPGSNEPGPSEPASEPSALITSSSGSSNSILSASKRWREIFKRTEKKPGSDEKPESITKKEKLEIKREKEKKNVTNNAPSSAELNINIWPFSRSRSAGNNSGRAKSAVQSNRKVSSAPCSRSNSSGESKSRKSWPSSPGRTGVHLGRSSPVWLVKKPGSNRVHTGSGNKNRVLKLNVPVCMGYRESLSCRSDESGPTTSKVNGNGINGNSFSLRGLFSKKSSTTVLTV